jgi:hypothetical protein
MAVSLKMMQDATARGLCAVCSTCELYWEARARGVVGDACLGSRCGSPLAGDTFRSYKGPMTDDALQDYCFVCGEASVKVLRVPVSDRLIGVCTEHLSYLFELVPVETSRARGSTLVRTVEGREFLVEDIAPSRRPRLLELMIQTEREWAEKYGWDFDPDDPFGLKGSA